MAGLEPGATVLVTGASGRIGVRVLGALDARGLRTRALIHRRPAPGAAEQIRGNLRDPDSLRGAAEGADAVLHMAATTHARRQGRYREVNRDGTARLVEAARDAGALRFVHVSTRAIAPEGGAYGRSKLDAEGLVEASGLDHVIVRLPEVVGTGGTEGVDGVIDRARRGAPVPVVGDGGIKLCPIHVDDAVEAIANALIAPVAGRTFTLAGECVSEREFARACISAAGSGSRVVRIPVAALGAASFLARFAPIPLYPDQLARHRAPKPEASSDAGPDLGFSPLPLHAILDRVLGG